MRVSTDIFCFLMLVAVCVQGGHALTCHVCTSAGTLTGDASALTDDEVKKIVTDEKAAGASQTLDVKCKENLVPTDFPATACAGACIVKSIVSDKSKVNVIMRYCAATKPDPCKDDVDKKSGCCITPDGCNLKFPEAIKATTAPVAEIKCYQCTAVGAMTGEIKDAKVKDLIIHTPEAEQATADPKCGANPFVKSALTAKPCKLGSCIVKTLTSGKDKVTLRYCGAIDAKTCNKDGKKCCQTDYCNFAANVRASSLVMCLIAVATMFLY